MKLYSVRIISLDSCMSAPVQGLDVMYSDFRGSSINQVPILRLFGSIPTGEKICVHIHGVFPYIYIPYDGIQEANSLMYRIAASIDKAVNISLKQASSNAQHVYKITLVKGIPMYGYHLREHQFFKIYLYNPLLVRKVASLLMNESTLGKLYQPHEAHLNFTLQFMIDFNLHGMSSMVVSEIKFRRNPDNPSQNINAEDLLPATVIKNTVCELEGDCLAENIVNREEISSGNIAANPGISSLWADEQQRRRNKGESSQIDHLLELNRTHIEPTKSHSVYKQALRDRLSMLSTERNIVEKINSSVYPAETPENLTIKNASMIESETPSSLELSLNDSSWNDLDETTKPSPDIDVNMTLDQDALNLLELLNELGEDAVEDSILTQVVKEDDEEKDLDLSMPLEAVTTPHKIVSSNNDNFEGSDDDMWNTTLIPQLDGESEEIMKNLTTEEYLSYGKRGFKNNDICSVNIKNSPARKLRKKAVFIKVVTTNKAGRDMPDLDEISEIDNEGTNLKNTSSSKLQAKPKKSVRFKRPLMTVIGESRRTKYKKKKLTRKELKERSVRKTEEEVKRLGNRIKKLSRQDQIIMIMRKLHKKEKRLILDINASGVPKFKVLSKDDVKAPYPLRRDVYETEFSKIKIISDIIVKTANYVDPSLHLRIKYPNHCCYLYDYNKKNIPDVIRIPRKICQSKNENDMNTFIKQNINQNENVEQIEMEHHFDELLITESSPRKESTNKNQPYLLTNEYSMDVKDQSSVDNIHIQTMKRFKETAASLTKQLHQHLELLRTPLISFDDNNNISFSSDEERASVLNKIKCLNRGSSKDIRYSNVENLIEQNSHKQSTSMPIMWSEIESIEKKEVECSDQFESNKTLNLNCDEEDSLSKISKNNFGWGNKFCLDRVVILSSSSTDITLCRKVTDFKEPIIEPVSIRRSERIRAIQNKNVIFSLDGTVDSCSSDDERTERKRKKSLKGTPSRESRRYKALPISVNKSPKVQINPERSASKCEVSMNTQNFQKDATLLDPKPIHTPVCDINVKRQLFTEDSPLNSTRIEEKLVCRHVSVAKRNCITQKIPDEGESEKSSSSIFSSDDDCNEMSFFNPLDIQENQTYTTPAEKYDKENNYVAKEGSSKMFTPLQSQTDPPDIHISSGSSGSVLITPGQRFVSDDEDLTKNSTAVIEKHFQINYLSSNSVTNSNSSSNISITTNKKGPSKREVVESMEKYGIAHVRQQVPFYSNVEDVAGSIEVGFNILKISSLTTAHLPEFESQTDSLNIFRKNKLDILSSTLQWSSSSIKTMILSFCKDRECIITPVKRTPTTKEVLNWLKEKAVNDVIKEKNIEKRTKIHLPLSPRNEGKDEEYDLDMSLTLTPCTPSNSQDSSKAAERSADSASPVFGKECKARKKEIFNKTLRTPLFPSQESSINHSCQITGLMVNHSFEKSARNLQDARAVLEHQNITVLVMELHIRTRGDFKPDPNHDSIRAIFYTIHHDVPEPSNKAKTCKGVIAINDLPLSSGVSNTPILNGIGLDCNIAYVDSEENLFDEFLKVIAYWDPDICAGYEIELLSWGYLMDRASHMGKNIKNLLGRTQINNLKWKDEEAPNELKITGRIVLDVWRLMRHEISLQSYTFESIMFHILHKREPYYSFRDLSFWWDHRSNLYRYRTVKYYITRVTAIIDLFDKLDFIGRTSELARLFGIQFFEVLSRGSQFRVESMMLRLAKPLNFIPVSPNVQQRAQMKAPEFISLVLEPESKLYNDPVIVLDFQSLYPSIIIAYNYCFTTCIGRVQSLGKNGPFEFGATQLKISRKLLRKLLEKDSLNFSPCGVGFVKKKVRDGIMPRMLREILDTRLMVKNSMKENKEDKILQKVLHSRQLGLKLIANVTYGYTAANFSGRMPSVEVGDSVVSKGRETLQRAIEMVDSTPEWGAKVVYGDTDSLFVLVPGQSRARAFEVGKQIADAVTKANPDPMKLKLEKVYQPCILQTKKRYVGYMFESIDQKEPIYEAKGIETVRRDGCPAVSKMLEKCLRLLFETKDVSLVKKYVLKQFNKIFSGRASIQDLTFAKEYRGAAGYRPGACVPALELTRKWTAVDKRNEPRSGERVPYVIINGPPGLPLIRLVRSPRDLLNDSSLRPNALYYITRVIIPPINRCFNLIGADLHTWFNQMPRKVTQYLSSSVSPKKKSTISQYFSTYTCACCGEQTQMGICQNCCCNPQKTVITLMEKMRLWENNFVNMNLVCHSCTSGSTEIKCVSLDCPVLYRRIQTARDVQQVDYVRRLLTTSDW
ncbi:DNA polymerase zeta catalytic subunit isoform X1 [Leptinotarsa decemlineata]|uniref:DNA polymerase zeta catalytic subunit isoform X1 n=1 Tax=Leptinotarsa decemlineata TaxID=7539 RepID=UPI003D3055B3